MKINNLIVGVVFTLLLVGTSCADQELVLPLDESAKLSVEIINEDETPVVGEQVSIANENSVIVAHALTDESGKINFGRMLSGKYYLSADIKVRDYEFYDIDENLDFTTSNDKTYVIKLGAAFKNKLNVKLLNSNNGNAPAANVKIIAYQQNHETNRDIYPTTPASIQAVSLYEWTTDAEGMFTAELPTGSSYNYYFVRSADDVTYIGSLDMSRNWDHDDTTVWTISL